MNHEVYSHGHHNKLMEYHLQTTACLRNCFCLRCSNFPMHRADVQIFGGFHTLASGKSCAKPIAISVSSENVPSRTNHFVKSLVHRREYACQISGPFTSFASFWFQGALRLLSPSRRKLLFAARTATSSRFHVSSVTPRRAGNFCVQS